MQPYVAQQGIIPFLTQEQLAIPPQPRVNFAVFVEIGRKGPGAGVIVQVEHRTLADVDEQADAASTSVTFKVSNVGRLKIR